MSNINKVPFDPLPHAPSYNSLVSGTPQMSPSLSESSVHSALKGSFGSFELATKSPCTSLELDQQYDTIVEENGQSFSLSDLTGSFSSSSVRSQTSLLA